MTDKKETKTETTETTGTPAAEEQVRQRMGISEDAWNKNRISDVNPNPGGSMTDEKKTTTETTEKTDKTPPQPEKEVKKTESTETTEHKSGE